MIPHAIYIKDLAGVYTYANAAFARLLGESDPEAPVGKHFADFFSPASNEVFAADDETLRRTGESITRIEQSCEPLKRDAPVKVFATKIPLTDRDGNCIGIAGISTDITAERASEDRMRLLVSALDVAVNGVVLTDRHGTILWVNKSFARITGYASEEVVGKNPRILKSGQHDKPFYRNLWATVLRGEVWSGEIINRRKDGQLYCELLTITPVCGPDGRPENFIAIKQDIGAQKMLRREMLLASTAIKNATAPVLILDEKGLINYANRTLCQLYGGTVTEIYGKSVESLLVVADGAPDASHPALVAPENERVEQPGHLLTKGGKTVPILVRVDRILDSSDDLLGYTCNLRDRSEAERQEAEKKRIEIRLRQAEKLESIGNLAAGIAHEINTPTQFVGDNLHFLQICTKDLLEVAQLARRLANDPTGPEATAAAEEIRSLTEEFDLDYYLEEIPEASRQATDGVRRIAEIVKAMKEFSHPGSKHRQLADLNAALQQAATVARNEWKYHSKLTFELDENLKPVRCLAGEINQVFLNIIVNAAHAVKEAVEARLRSDGSIHIATRQLEEHVEITISDNGTGIPEDIRDRIFDPFFTTKKVGQGTGQGLAIAYDVVAHKHQGELICESVLHEGTSFLIRLRNEPREHDGNDA